MLKSGTKPTSYSSTLTGMAKSIYDSKIANGSIPPESLITFVIGGVTYTEAVSKNHDRILNAKLECWVTADSLISNITANAIVTTPSGIPVSTTGSAAAQTGTTTAAGTGTIS